MYVIAELMPFRIPLYINIFIINSNYHGNTTPHPINIKASMKLPINSKVTCTIDIMLYALEAAMVFNQGKELHRGSGRFRPQNAKKELSKIKKEPLKICHRLQCKSLSVQFCRFSQWDVKSSPRK